MKAADIVASWYNNKEVNDCLANRFPADLVDDVRQDLFEILLTTDEERIMHLHNTGKMRFYIVRIIINLSRQERNVVFKNYRPPHSEYECEDLPDDFNDPVVIKHERKRLLEFEKERWQAIAKLHWYEWEVFKLWIELGSLQKVADYTNINHNSLKKTVALARRKVREFMEEKA